MKSETVHEVLYKPFLYQAVNLLYNALKLDILHMAVNKDWLNFGASL